MMKRAALTVARIAAATLSLTAASAFAQMDVDQADSLNFQSFHKDKKEAMKAWKDDKTQQAETVKAYEQNGAAASSTSTAPTAAAVPAPSTAASTPTPKPASAAIKPGQRFELRERYTLSTSVKTPYSAFYVIGPLFKQAAQLCPRGWRKLAERSEPVEQDFFLYNEIECL